ncbi:hypothetical protein N6B72_14670 [Chryseobacterium soli]|uniref:hypothetical protein n=1 Tax=Chryseobacterium soli TaxID=445961 RepID=UPI0029536833|nr:hypothetical protein [Chryseobacterium soli]MDV7698167.1 hypothetical protein [Chryseobacterium soli]
MKTPYFYPLTLFFGILIIILSSFSLERGRHMYRNQWMIPAQKNLTVKNSSKENLNVVLYNPSTTDALQYLALNNEIKEIPKNDSVVTKINFKNKLQVVNNSNHETIFKLKILNNSGRIKAAVSNPIVQK